MADIPIVYTLTVCPACDALRASWKQKGIEYQEIRGDQSQVERSADGPAARPSVSTPSRMHLI